jgi:uncharacterized protein YxjI
MSRAAAAAASRLVLLRAAWTQQAPLAAALRGISISIGTSSGPLAVAARTISSEAALRARRLAASQARRQQQHERAVAAARLAARSPPATTSSTSVQGQPPPPPPAPRSSLTSLDPGDLRPSDAAAVARAVAHPALVVTRAIEWGTVVFGFEQANKYTVYDQDGQQVALIAEEVTGVGNALQRQLLRTRRAFTATVLSPSDGSVLFRVRRPPYLISSTTYVETADGQAVGEVRQRWHPLRRNFDLYIGQQQYARISGPLLAWEFELTDDQGKTLALIDRNFQGFAKELFTDAGKYCVHFGYGDPQEAAAAATRTLEARSGRTDFAPVVPLQIGAGGGGGSATTQQQQQQQQLLLPQDQQAAVAVIPQTTGAQLAVSRPLALDERMVALAAAVAIDFAFFSQHSHTSGMFAPPLLFPMPFPGGAGGEGGEGGAGGGAAAEEAAGGEGAAPVGGDGGVGGGVGGGVSSTPPPPTQEEDAGWGWADQDKGGGGGEEQGDSGWTDAWGGGGGGGDGDDDGGEGVGGTVGSFVRGLWRVFGDDD